MSRHAVGAAAVMLVAMALPLAASCSQTKETHVTMANERVIADRLAQDVARLRGIEGEPLRGERIAYGTLQFEYLADEQALKVAILVSEDELWNQLGDEFRENYLRSTRALSDPRIGGMFDTAGGAWEFDPKTGKTFLYRLYPLTAQPAAITVDIERMSDVVPAWETRWSAVVAEISQGRLAPPTRPVTLENDPYRDQF